MYHHVHVPTIALENLCVTSSIQTLHYTVYVNLLITVWDQGDQGISPKSRAEITKYMYMCNIPEH